MTRRNPLKHLLVCAVVLLQACFPTPEDRASQSAAQNVPATSAAPRTVRPSVTLERTISRADFDEDWPFTVDSGTLACRSLAKAVTFTAGGTTYAVNGTASTLQTAVPVDPIWAYAPPVATDVDIVDRMPLSDREEIYRQLLSCEDQAMLRADREVPITDRTSLEANVERMRELEAECERIVRNRWSISEDEEARIGLEGVTGSLPAARVIRKSIGSIVQAGLALCDE